jgi:hypothetical protein
LTRRVAATLLLLLLLLLLLVGSMQPAQPQLRCSLVQSLWQQPDGRWS